MVTPVGAFGLVSGALSIVNSIRTMINGDIQAHATETFRDGVNTKLGVIQSQLDDVKANLIYVEKEGHWNHHITSLDDARSSIGSAWTTFGMQAFLTTPGAKPSADLNLDQSDVKSLIENLSTSYNYITGQQPDSDSQEDNKPLLELYLGMVYGTPADQLPPASPCEMAYHYWRNLLSDQLKAVLMYAIAGKQSDPGKGQDLLDPWTTQADDNRFKQEGKMCEAVVASQLNGTPGDTPSEIDANIRKFCSATPWPQSLTSSEVDLRPVNQNFYLADISASIEQVPADEVLVSWGFEAVNITTWSGGSLLLIPVLYSGKFDPESGLVSPPPGQTGFTETSFKVDPNKCWSGRWLDNSCKLYTNPVENNGIVQASVEPYYYNAGSGLRQYAYTDANVQYGIDQVISCYWNIGYIGNVQPIEEQKGGIPLGIAADRLLTGVTFETPARLFVHYDGGEQYDPSGPPPPDGGVIIYKNRVRLFIQVQSASPDVAGNNSSTLNGRQWVSSESGVADLSANPVPGNLIVATKATTRCVGGVANSNYKSALTHGTPMPPLTGAGITFYDTPDNQVVIAPLNIYAYRVNKFNL